MKTDAIAIVEAAYDLGAETRDWLGRILDLARPRLDQGHGVAAIVFDPVSGFDTTSLVTRGMDDCLMGLLDGLVTSHADTTRSVHTTPSALGTAAQLLGMTEKETLVFPPYQALRQFGVYDILGVNVLDLSGRSYTFSAPMRDVKRPPKRDVELWTMIAAHVAAGARLRRSLHEQRQTNITDGADAILSPGGAVEHAEADAQSKDSRAALLHAALAMDRARGKTRTQDAEALELWRGLVGGRWSMVDHFDSDGRRYIVARKNDPDVVEPRALTLRERQVLGYVGLGKSVKEISYALGLPAGQVSAHRVTAMKKLGLRSTREVVKYFARAPGDSPPK